MSLIHRSATLALLLTLASACSSTGDIAERQVRTLDSRPDDKTPRSLMGLPLRTGQLVLTEAPGDLSFFFPLVPKTFYRFTHAALLVFEDGQPFVYDIVGELSVLDAIYADRPTDAVAGKVRRNTFYDYVKPNLYAEIYDPPEGVDPDKLAAWIQQKYRDETPFDPYFDYADHDALFCTEFVSQALEAAGSKTIELVPRKPNASLKEGIAWLNVPDGKFLPAGLFADPKRYRGACGSFPNLNMVRSYYAAKREIHRRFTADQKLGNIFLLDGLEIFPRPELDDFVRRSTGLFAREREQIDEATINQAVGELAAQLFGPFPG